MQRIPSWISRHYAVLHVRLHYLDNGWLDRQDRQLANQGQPLCAALGSAFRQVL